MSKEFTTKDKVLVNLLEFFPIRDRYPKSVELTQEGMAERTGSKQNTISYAVRNLLEEGYIYEETTRVKGKKQRLKVYFLTEKGMDKAKEIRNQMSLIPVSIVKGSDKKEVLAKDINMYYHTNYSLLDIILLRERGTFAMDEKKREPPKISYLPYLSEPPVVEPDGYDELKDWWSKKDKFLLVEGEPGTGRTSLISKFAHEIISDCNVFYFKLRKWHTRRYLWYDLANFLSSAGEHKLYAYLEASEQVSFREALRVLLLDLECMSDTVIIIEDIDKEDTVLELIFDIIDNIQNMEHVTVVMSGEPNMKIPGSLEKGGIHRLVLEYDECKKPMFVELGKTYGLDEGCEVVLDVILEGKLTPEEFIAIAYMAIHRLPVDRSNVLSVGEVNKNLFNELLKTPLISSTMGDKVILHDFVAERVAYRLWEEEMEILHSFAEEYYYTMPGKTPDEKVEFLYHSVRAGDLEGFLEGLHDFGEDIIRSGYSEQLIRDIDEIDANIDIKGEGGAVTFWKGEARRTIHRYDKALEAYNELLEVCGEDEIVTRAHMGVAAVMEAKRQYNPALEQYEEAAKKAQKLGKKGVSLLGNIYHKLAYIYSRKGTYPKAKEYLNKAITLLEEQKSYSLLTTSYLLSAQLEKERGALKEALKLLEKGMKSWRLIDETYERVGGLHDIGSFYKVIRELEGAEEFLTEAVESCEQFGYTHLKGMALLTLAECYVEKGEDEKAIACAGTAREIFNFLDLMDEEAYSHAFLGQSLAKLDRDEDAEKHFNKAITIYHRSGATYALGLVYFSMAKLQEKNGNKTGVAENYRKSVISLISSGAGDVAEHVERAMKSVPLTM